ncbi:hypothetical protein NEFER03_2113 [Nematocida sp. LUAm3]|nr:hypothetical protein NEFER03_2113 [Nematocida sp. LUAm3]KAI5175635.1 hypothetical protein NEFER02_1522 [Nematocida sp. LUAm2]KAI5178541.1 hypothetical protein NEFER01_1677 [Nematocida sp. LUAm1]
MAEKMSTVEEKENGQNIHPEQKGEKRKPVPLDYEAIQKSIETSIDSEIVEEPGISLKIPEQSGNVCITDPSPFTFKENSKNMDDAVESNYQCCGESLPTLHDLVSHYEKCHYKFISTESKKEGLQHVKWHGGEEHNEVVQVPTVVFNDNSMTYDYSKPTAFYNTILQSESLSLGVLLPPVVVKDFNMDAEVEMIGESHYEDEDKKRPFKCTHPGCNKKYTSAYGLKYHMSRGHLGGGLETEKPYACDVPGCGKRYKNANGLKYHFNNGH